MKSIGLNGNNKSQTIILVFTFLLSGFSALTYQIVWQRFISFFIGSDTISSALNVASFMAGLGLGNLLGGYLADHVSNKNRLIIFSSAELLLGIFGFFSKSIFYEFLYQNTALDIPSKAILFCLLFIVLLIPTTLMGITLPLLSKTLTNTGMEASKSIGTLYSINTFGACLGAFMTTLIILPLMGFEKGYLVASGLNIASSILIIFLILLTEKQWTNKVASNKSFKSSFTWDNEFIKWMSIYFLSGFIAIALEVIWFRVCGNIIKSDAYSYGLILSFYLLGLALGGVIGTWICQKRINASATFLILQICIPLISMGLIYIFSNLASAEKNFLGLYIHLQNYDYNFELKNMLVLYGFVPGLIILIPTIIMGITFPLIQKITNNSFDSLGRKIGWLMFANILGNILGAVGTSFFLFETIGTAGALKLCAFLSIFFIGYLFKENFKRLSLLCLSLSLIFTFVFFNNNQLWSKLQATPSELLVYIENASGISSLKLNEKKGEHAVVFSNNLGQSWLPYTAGDVHFLLGAAPAFIHPNPKKIAIIGLGSGSTLFGAACRPTIDKIVCFEIMKGQKELLVKYSENGYLPVKELISNKKIQFVEKDGRYELYKSSEKYDIIEADALRPISAYSGNLYSIEYFQLLKSKLNKGGIAVTWAPTKRIFNSFCLTFPYVTEIQGILFGSEQPIHFIKNRTETALENVNSTNYFKSSGINISERVYTWMGLFKNTDKGTINSSIINTDLYPVDELTRNQLNKLFNKSEL